MEQTPPPRVRVKTRGEELAMEFPEERVRTGDRISLRSSSSTGSYQVIAIHEDKCWIRHDPSGDDQIVPLAFCMIERIYH